MKTYILIQIIFSVLISSTFAEESPVVEALLAYQKFQKDYPRMVLNEAEQDYRLTIFLENYKKIQNHNSNPDNTYQVGVNRFSDMTKQEFSQKILQNSQVLQQSKDQVTQRQATPHIQEVVIAEEVDWRKKGVVTPVKNQGECGSCWIFSGTGAMESFNAIHNNALQSFSEQQFLDCVPQGPNSGYYSYGCEGGVPADVFQYASIYGVKTEQEYPYIGIQGACNTTNSTSTTFKPKSYDSLSEGDNEGFIATLNLVPISVAIDATNLADYVSGVFNNCNSTLNGVNHAVLAVGYDKQGNWIVKNSWADDWGQQGYFLLAPNNTCGILDMAFYISS
ncbi:hypothetical protein ABPG74_008002 [Tetrahymena malaccensis]